MASLEEYLLQSIDRMELFQKANPTNYITGEDFNYPDQTNLKNQLLQKVQESHFNKLKEEKIINNASTNISDHYLNRVNEATGFVPTSPENIMNIPSDRLGPGGQFMAGVRDKMLKGDYGSGESSSTSPPDDRGWFEKTWSGINTGLDYALSALGTIPVAGIIPDAVNVVQNAISGGVAELAGYDDIADYSWENTAWAAGAMIPIGGQYITGAKYTKNAVNAIKAIDKAGDISKMSSKALKATDEFKALNKVDQDQLLLIFKDVKGKGKDMVRLAKENPTAAKYIKELNEQMVKHGGDASKILDKSETIMGKYISPYYKKYMSDPLRKNAPWLYNTAKKNYPWANKGELTTKIGDAGRWLNPRKKYRPAGGMTHLPFWATLGLAKHGKDIYQGEFGSLNWDDPSTPEKEGFGDAWFTNSIWNTFGAGPMLLKEGWDAAWGQGEEVKKEDSEVEGPEVTEKNKYDTADPVIVEKVKTSTYNEEEQAQIDSTTSKLESLESKYDFSDGNQYQEYMNKIEQMYKNSNPLIKAYLDSLGYTPIQD